MATSNACAATCGAWVEAARRSTASAVGAVGGDDLLDVIGLVAGPALAGEDLDLVPAGEARGLDQAADAAQVDAALAHQAAVVEQVAGLDPPVAEVEAEEQAERAAARDLRLELGIPP